MKERECVVSSVVIVYVCVCVREIERGCAVSSVVIVYVCVRESE